MMRIALDRACFWIKSQGIERRPDRSLERSMSSSTDSP
jgi:hypothetical protein